MSQVSIQCLTFTDSKACITVGGTSNLKWLIKIWYFIVIGRFILSRMQCQIAIYFQLKTVYGYYKDNLTF